MKTLHIVLFTAVLAIPALTHADGPEKPTPEKRDAKPKKKGKKKGGGYLPRGFSLDAMETLGADKGQLKALGDLAKTLKRERRTLIEELRAEGTLDRSMRKALDRKLRARFVTKMKVVLSKDQYKAWRGRSSRTKNKNTERGGDKGRDEERDDELRKRALKVLAVSDEEAAVLSPLVDGVLQTRRILREEGQTRRAVYLEKVAKLEDAAAVAALLAEFRKQRKEDEESLKKSRHALRETLTAIQEARLVGLGILD
ncbi:MAG: hypothetical protein JKY65_24840 [Planctomycetes bacterium]|nr:hypothetical protein [Planctomycetota bacterium]